MPLSTPASALLLAAAVAADPAGRDDLFPPVREFAAARAAEFGDIPADRKVALDEIAAFVRSRRDAGRPARLTFICTHNSRRSHLGQLWAATAAAYYGVGGVETFSGGTEATAFNPRAVAAVERVGFEVEKSGDGANPRYAVRSGAAVPASTCFSKVYDDPANPQEDFCAVMTCSSADAACPVVAGAAKRVAVPYDDPKAADGTPGEAAAYDAACRTIAREMLYVFSRVGG